jgi:RNA polymerase sigma-70 factor, ECF subfamily
VPPPAPPGRGNDCGACIRDGDSRVPEFIYRLWRRLPRLPPAVTTDQGAEPGRERTEMSLEFQLSPARLKGSSHTTDDRPTGRSATTEMIDEHVLDPQSLGDHLDRLYRAARALCDSREEAEDLVQETIARVLRRPRTLRADNDIGYLLRALRNTFLGTRRAAARRPRINHHPDQMEFIEDRRAVRAEARAEAAEVYAAISALPDDFRDALVAIDVAGLSYRETARALGVQEATIATRLHRARQRVARAVLAEDEATPG